MAEAAYGPGVPFYLSFFFRRDELALRTGLFISAAPLATSFASSLAWVITFAGLHSSIAAWRLLFLLEGFPSLVVAVFAWYLPDHPGNARFFSSRAKRVAVLRLRHEKSSQPLSKQKLSWHEVGKTLIDPKCYLTSVCQYTSMLRTLGAANVSSTVHVLQLQCRLF